MFDYLSYIKEELKLDKISNNDLSENEYKQLKEMLGYIKNMLDKSA